MQVLLRHLKRDRMDEDWEGGGGEEGLGEKEGRGVEKDGKEELEEGGGRGGRDPIRTAGSKVG